jgi:ribosome-associated toxin RatA of RatAB toxin-antitoxin module
MKLVWGASPKKCESLKFHFCSLESKRSPHGRLPQPLVMASVSRSALVSHSADAMFQLVDDVERYPLFLPWCSKVDLLERDPSMTRARLYMSYMGIRVAFATRNIKHASESMVIALEEGPFRHLSGRWTFQAIQSLGCRVELSLQYEFESGVLAGAVGPVFDRVASSLVDSFVEEADRRTRFSGLKRNA